MVVGTVSSRDTPSIRCLVDFRDIRQQLRVCHSVLQDEMPLYMGFLLENGLAYAAREPGLLQHVRTLIGLMTSQVLFGWVRLYGAQLAYVRRPTAPFPSPTGWTPGTGISHSFRVDDKTHIWNLRWSRGCEFFFIFFLMLFIFLKKGIKRIKLKKQRTEEKEVRNRTREAITGKRGGG